MKALNQVKFIAIAAMVLLILAAQPSLAQQVTGRLQGTIRDSSGGLIPGASVVVKQLETGVERTAISTSVGDYSFPLLAIGTYEVRVESSGFAPMTKQMIQIVVGQTTQVDFTLSVARVAQTTTVSASTPVFDTSSSSVGTTQTLQEIQPLPLEVNSTARTVTDFLQIQPGVIYQNSPFAQSGSIIQGTGDGGGFRQTTGYYIDGLAADSQPTQALAGNYGIVPDVVQEFRLTTNSEASYGWTTGPGIDIVTKSGTNVFHGDAWEYFRNNVLDSRNWFATKASPEKQNEFGGVLGGPLLKNRLFFIGSLDRYTFRTSNLGVVATVPTAQMLSGDFSELLGPQIGTDALGRPIYQGEIYDPSTTRPDGNGGYIRDPFSYNGTLNVIPPADFSKLSQYFQKGYPAPNKPGTENNWVGSTNPESINQMTSFIKIDGNFGKHHLFIGYEDMPQFEFSCYNPLPAFGTQINTCTPQDYRQYRIQANYFLTIRPDLLLNVRAGKSVNGAHIITSPPNGGAEAGITGLYGGVTPLVSIQNTTGFGAAVQSQIQRFAVYSTNGDITWIKGRHSVSAGAQFIMPETRQGYSFYSTGSYNFISNETGFPGYQTTGWGYASFLLGDVDSGMVMSPVSQVYSSEGWGFYVQDKWRLSTKLTLNVGLRYDVDLPPREELNRESYFDPLVPNPGAGGIPGALTFMGAGQGRNGQIRQSNVYWKAFGPRIGVAYQVLPKTVVRAYFGIQYFPQFAANYMGQAIPQIGWNAQQSIASENSGLTPSFEWDNGWPLPLPVLPDLDPSLANGSSVPYINPKQNEDGLAQNVGFGLERELGAGVSVRADYIGKFSHHMPTNNLVALNQINPSYLALGDLLLADINSPEAAAAGINPPYPGFTGTVGQALRPFPQFNDIPQIDAKLATSNFNALEISAHKRFVHGLSLLGSYTWSRITGNDQTANFESFTAPLYIQHTAFRSTYNSVLYSEVPQVLSLSYVYDIPFGPQRRFASQRGWINAVIGGWTISGIQLYEAGSPVPISTNITYPSIEDVWANRVPNVSVRTSTGCSGYDPYNTGNRYLNISAFNDPAPFTFGNTNVLPNVHGCGYANEDLSLQKTLTLKERLGMTVGADFLNAFNRHYWTGLNSNIDDPIGFGQFTGATAPRVIQLRARISF